MPKDSQNIWDELKSTVVCRDNFAGELICCDRTLLSVESRGSADHMGLNILKFALKFTTDVLDSSCYWDSIIIPYTGCLKKSKPFVGNFLHIIITEGLQGKGEVDLESSTGCSSFV
jgi:hypothetical protein